MENDRDEPQRVGNQGCEHEGNVERQAKDSDAPVQGQAQHNQTANADAYKKCRVFAVIAGTVI